MRARQASRRSFARKRPLNHPLETRRLRAGVGAGLSDRMQPPQQGPPIGRRRGRMRPFEPGKNEAIDVAGWARFVMHVRRRRTRTGCQANGVFASFQVELRLRAAMLLRTDLGRQGGSIFTQVERGNLLGRQLGRAAAFAGQRRRSARLVSRLSSGLRARPPARCRRRRAVRPLSSSSPACSFLALANALVALLDQDGPHMLFEELVPARFVACPCLRSRRHRLVRAATRRRFGHFMARNAGGREGIVGLGRNPKMLVGGRRLPIFPIWRLGSRRFCVLCLCFSSGRADSNFRITRTAGVGEDETRRHRDTEEDKERQGV